MKLTVKNKIVLSLIYGLYHLIMQFYFNSFQFLNCESYFALYQIVLFLLLVLLQFSFLFFLIKNTQSLNKIFISSSFVISGLLLSTFLWLFFSKEHQFYFTFIFSFVISSFIPSIIFFFYFIYLETLDKFSKMSSVSLKESGLENEHEKIFHLENANGKVLLEVPMNKIICFEANDNYVITYYLKNETEISKSMERISLKKIEEIVDVENVHFKRVHKSYLINPFYLEEISGRAQAYKIKLKFFKNLIPVSRTYEINELKR